MRNSERPVILAGHGIRASGAADLAPLLLDLGIPVLASWQAKDLFSHEHSMFFGCPGIYGTRLANKVLAHADHVLAIGNRMSIWNVGYEGLPKRALVEAVDVQAQAPGAKHIVQDAKAYIEELLKTSARFAWPSWVAKCATWRAIYPLIESPTHDDHEGHINSYRFVDALHEYLRADEIVAIDCGAAAACAFQTLRPRPPQRLLSSGGLGEMGCAIPAAIGASFARNKGEVLCLVGDGAMMLNLQELQTIVHHDLPVKIIVFRNDGYLMIKHTQKLAGMDYSGVDKPTGVSVPSFNMIAYAFRMHTGIVQTWEDFRRMMPQFFSHKGPAMIEYRMHPEQKIYPKLDPVRNADGSVSSPPFDKMSPVLT